MDEAQFTRRVARLNANVLYLCFSQNIDLSNLKACETIHNILKLMDTSNPHLGRLVASLIDAHASKLACLSIVEMFWIWIVKLKVA
jgi:beclin 1-associated autophagy-related key regulator